MTTPFPPDQPEEPQPPKSVAEVLESIRLDNAVMHMDWNLPTCVGCGRHFTSDRLRFTNGPESGRCAECQDTALWAATGCRFGLPEFCMPDTHPDCHLPDGL